MYERLTALQEGLIPKKKAATDDDLHRINELIQVGPVAPQPRTIPLLTKHLLLLVKAKADLKKPMWVHFLCYQLEGAQVGKGIA